MAAYFQIMQNVNVGGRAGKSMYQYTLQSSDTETLYQVGPEMMEKIAKLPGLRDVTSDLYIKNPKISLQIDREAGAVYGVTQDQIRQELLAGVIWSPRSDRMTGPAPGVIFRQAAKAVRRLG